MHKGTKAKMGEGRIHREGTAGAKVLRQDYTSEEIKGSAAGEPGGRERRWTGCVVMVGIVKMVIQFQPAHASSVP